MSVFKGSRYTKTKITVKNGTIILEERKKAVFDLTNSKYYTVIQGDTLDGIAFRQYGNAQLFWAIIDANPAYQSEMDLRPGDNIIIPPLEEVMKYV